jgi:hypothetical protein
MLRRECWIVIQYCHDCGGASSHEVFLSILGIGEERGDQDVRLLYLNRVVPLYYSLHESVVGSTPQATPAVRMCWR